MIVAEPPRCPILLAWLFDHAHAPRPRPVARAAPRPPTAASPTAAHPAPAPTPATVPTPGTVAGTRRRRSCGAGRRRCSPSAPRDTTTRGTRGPTGRRGRGRRCPVSTLPPARGRRCPVSTLPPAPGRPGGSVPGRRCGSGCRCGCRRGAGWSGAVWPRSRCCWSSRRSSRSSTSGPAAPIPWRRPRWCGRRRHTEPGNRSRRPRTATRPAGPDPRRRPRRRPGPRSWWTSAARSATPGSTASRPVHASRTPCGPPEGSGPARRPTD